jgi:signal transduction histidine kinase
VARIFDPLTTKKISKGAGQGLAIVNRVVIVAWRLDVQSTVGEGTRSTCGCRSRAAWRRWRLTAEHILFVDDG